MLAGRVSPRVVPVPERFSDYHAGLDKQELRIWETDVFDAICKGTSPQKIVQSSVEVGWDPNYAEWLVYFTEAQKRPIHVMPAAEYLWERDKNVDDKYRQKIWQWAIAFIVIEFLAVPSILVLGLLSANLFLTVLLFIVLARTYCGFQFFATWAEQKGYDSTYGWWVLIPWLGLVVLALLPNRRERLL